MCVCVCMFSYIFLVKFNIFSIFYFINYLTLLICFQSMCTWKLKQNMVIAITFERKASARLSNWLKKVRDNVKVESWMLPHVFE